MHKRTVGVNCVKKHLIMIDGKRHEIKTKHGNTGWLELKKYLNSLEPEELFTRKQMLNNVYTIDVSNLKFTAADTYKGYLNKLGFISKQSHGIYIKKLHIPMKLTLVSVKKALKDESWKTWFIPLHIRLGLNEQIE